jgi:hypothetical protein
MARQENYSLGPFFIRKSLGPFFFDNPLGPFEPICRPLIVIFLIDHVVFTKLMDIGYYLKEQYTSLYMFSNSVGQL